LNYISGDVFLSGQGTKTQC